MVVSNESARLRGEGLAAMERALGITQSDVSGAPMRATEQGRERSWRSRMRLRALKMKVAVRRSRGQLEAADGRAANGPVGGAEGLCQRIINSLPAT
jgi:hypothetical protein